ncbi:hypothetical protein ACMDCR_25790 [Labrys okinawensis]|uniref:hypothetical protein n=1 Tax=Labrys okinawensis TaxID=346911 RepID=UPI0039BCDC0C
MIPKIDDPLFSPKCKLARAKTLIAEIEEKTQDFVRTAPIELADTPHPNTASKRAVFLMAPTPPPVEISLIIGDAIQNLRAVFDHIVACLALAEGNSYTGVSFPFNIDSTKFEQDYRRSTRKISPRARKLIYRLKPYGGGDYWLYLLNKLSNADKHRTLTLCAVSVGRLVHEVSCDTPFEASKDFTGRLTQGIHLFTYPADAKFEIRNAKADIALAFLSFSEAEDRPVLDILRSLCNRSERILIMFERLFFK